MRIPEFGIGDHRVCRIFKPTTEYRRLISWYVSPQGHVYHRPLAQRMHDFGFLAFGYLYTFCYNYPPGRKRAMRLTDRLPNHALQPTAAPPVLSGVTGNTGVVGAFIGHFQRLGSLGDFRTSMIPESYNRLQNPSKLDFDAFVHWLSQASLSELSAARGDSEATRAAFIRYFQRGFRAGLLLDELMQILFFQPSRYTSVFGRVGYSEIEAQAMIQMVKGLNMQEIGFGRDETVA
jgi:hypothetical protein